jgi:hypothetical protein
MSRKHVEATSQRYLLVFSRLQTAIDDQDFNRRNQFFQPSTSVRTSSTSIPNVTRMESDKKVLKFSSNKSRTQDSTNRTTSGIGHSRRIWKNSLSLQMLHYLLNHEQRFPPRTNHDCGLSQPHQLLRSTLLAYHASGLMGQSPLPISHRQATQPCVISMRGSAVIGKFTELAMKQNLCAFSWRCSAN